MGDRWVMRAAGAFGRVVRQVALATGVVMAGAVAVPQAAVAAPAAPTITGIAPNRGSAAGGNTVVISGTNLDGATRVSFDGVAAPAIVVGYDGRSLNAVAPPHAAGIVTVQVTTPGGTASATNVYTYLATCEVTASASRRDVDVPGSGKLARLRVPYQAYLGEDAGPEIFRIAGEADTRSLASACPTSTLQGTARVSYVGNNVALAPGWTFRFDYDGATLTSPANSDVIYYKPGGALGKRTLTGIGTLRVESQQGVFRPGWDWLNVQFDIVQGTSSAGTAIYDASVYVVPEPYFYTFSARSGPIAGGNTIAITGVNFSDSGNTVTLGGIPVTLEEQSSTTLRFVAPAHAAGEVQLVLTTEDGQVRRTGYTYVAPPAIGSLSSTRGPTEGGDTITINGANFTEDTVVTFGDSVATGLEVEDGDVLRVTVPARGAGTVAVTVATPGGSASLTPGYTYAVYAAPSITASPSNQRVASGAPATFTAAATGEPAVSVQWQRSDGPTGGFSNIWGATGTSYRVGNAWPYMTGYRYRAVFSNSRGSATSEPATLAVVQAPTAADQGVGAVSGVSRPITLGGTDRNTPPQPLTYAVVGSGPAHGTLAGTAPDLTYTPAAGYTGTDSFTFTASNDVATSAPATVTITVTAPIAITPASLPDGTVETPYGATLTATGTTAPYSFAVTGGSLPPGLTLSPEGTIAGTPDAEGSYTFTVTATDSAASPASGEQSYTMMIGAPAGGLTRTWVSGVGDDANACTRIAPCQTFAVALARTATGGEINCLDAGGYGPARITRSVSISCGDRVGRGGVLVSGGNGITVAAPADARVVLSGLDFEGVGNSAAPAGVNGVRFESGASLLIRNATFRGFRGHAIDVEPTTAAQLDLVNVRVVDSGDPGDAAPGSVLVRAAGSVTVRATMSGVQVANGRTAGIALETASGTTGQVHATIEDSVVTGNTGAGIVARALGGTVQVSVGDSSVVGNVIGIGTEGAGAAITAADTTIARNGIGIASTGGATRSAGGNRLAGNDTDGAFSGTAPRQ